MFQDTRQLQVDDQTYHLQTEISYTSHPTDPDQRLVKVIAQINQTTPISQAKPHQTGKHVILLLDTSGSMLERIDELKSGVIRAIDKLNSNDELTVITFDSRSTILGHNIKKSDTNAIIELKNKIAAAGLSGKTCLNLALDDLRQSVTITNHLTTAIYLLTDGQIRGPVFEQALTNLQTHFANHMPRIYPIGLGEDVEYEALDKIAAISGSVAQHIVEATQFEQIITNESLLRARLPVSASLQIGQQSVAVDLKQIVLNTPFELPLQEIAAESLTDQERIIFDVNGVAYPITFALSKECTFIPELVEEYYLLKLVAIFFDKNLKPKQKIEALSALESNIQNHLPEAAGPRARLQTNAQELREVLKDPHNKNRWHKAVADNKTLVSAQKTIYSHPSSASFVSMRVIEPGASVKNMANLTPSPVIEPDAEAASKVALIKKNITALEGNTIPFRSATRKAKVAALKDLADVVKAEQPPEDKLATINILLAKHKIVKIFGSSRTDKVFAQIHWSYMDKRTIVTEIEKLKHTLNFEMTSGSFSFFKKRKASKSSFLAELIVLVETDNVSAIEQLPSKYPAALQGKISQRTNNLYVNLLNSAWYSNSCQPASEVKSIQLTKAC